MKKKITPRRRAFLRRAIALTTTKYTVGGALKKRQPRPISLAPVKK